MLAELINGILTRSKNSGASAPARSCQSGELAASDAHGRYQEAVLQGNVFSATNTAALALSVNSTTATGLILTNPAGSGKNLVILEWIVHLASLPAGQTSLILTGNLNPVAAVVTHTTPLVVQNAFIGSGAAAVGLADSAATIPNATIFRVISGGTAATVAASTAFPPFIKDELGGIRALAPGTCISLQCLATAVSVISSVTWEEVPV